MCIGSKGQEYVSSTKQDQTGRMHLSNFASFSLSWLILQADSNQTAARLS